MSLMRQLKYFSKQLISLAMILVVWMSWITVPVCSSSLPAPSAKTIKADTSKPPSRPISEKITKSSSPDVSITTPPQADRLTALASVSNFFSDAFSNIYTVIKAVAASIPVSSPEAAPVTTLQQQCTTPPSGIVSWWPGDGNADDIQGGNNGQLRGDAAIAPGKVGQGFSLDGENDYVDVGDVDLPVAFSIEAWINPHTLTNNPVVISKDDGLGSRSYFFQIESSGRLAGSVQSSSGFTQYRTDAPAVTTDAWQHVVMTYDGNAGPDQKMKFYVNSVNAPAMHLPGYDNGGTPVNIGLSTKIGIFGDGSSFSFNGLVDELTLYNRGITSSDIRAIYEAGSAGKCKTEQPCTTPPLDMVSWWPGDGNANDIQDGNHGAPQNEATFAPGIVGQAFSFDGVDDYVAISNAPSLTLNAQFTVEFWMRPAVTISRATTNAPYLLAKGPNDSIGFANGGGQIEVRGFTQRLFSKTNTWTAGTWYHIALTFDATDYKLFVNGIQDQEESVASSYSILSSSNALSLGGLGAPNNSFNGQLDEVTINSRALTASEIQAIYNVGSAGKCKPQCTSSPSGMIMWSPGDGNAIDLSGNGQNGTIEGGVTFSQGKVSQAFNFDGIDGRVRVPDSPVLRSGTGELTIDAWIKAPTGAAVRTFIGKEDQLSPKHPSTVFRLNPEGKLEFVVTDCGTGACGFSDPGGNGSRQPVQSPSRIDDDIFHHVVGVRRSTGYELYIDGQLVATRTEEARNNDNSWPLFIGIQGVGTDGKILNPFEGVVDEVGIYNRALTTSEIQAIYNAGSAGKCKTPTSTSDLSLTKTDSPDPVAAGSNLTYTVTITNNGPDDATGVVMTDTLPSGVNFVSANPTQGSCSQSAGTVNCNIGSLTNGASATATIIVTTTAPGTISNTASVAGSGADPITANNTATESTTVDAPDLQVSAVTAPSQTLTDRAFDLSWTLVNSGQGRAEGPWVDRVFLSTDNQLGSDTMLVDFPFSQSIDPDQSAARTQTISIPRSAIPSDGQYFLIVSTDANNNVDEGSNEGNNWSAKPITINRPSLPDLIVEAIEAPDTTFFDLTIAVRWTVKNIGSGATDAAEWKDTVFLSRDRTLSEVAFQLDVSNISYLNAGESYVASANVRIPRGLVGTFYIIVRTDSGNAVLEDNQDNNTLDKAINLELPPVPDLQVTLVQAPEEGFAGDKMRLGWRVENKGTGATAADQGAWFDAIYLSKDTNFDPATDRLIGSRRHEGGLAKDEGYTVSDFSADIPGNIAGDWYVFVLTDHQGNVYELFNENNNTGHDQQSISIQSTPPDLIVTAFTAPDEGTAARQITVNWTVKNQGAFVASGSWFDTVYLSTDDTLDPETDRPLASVSHDGGLEPGLSYDASATVSLAACTSGTHYLFVFTDSRDQTFEFDPVEDAEKNNFSGTQAVQITSAPSDLQVTAVTNATTGNAGQPFSVAWTVVNQGVGPTIEGSWVDNVYLSPAPVFNAGTALLAGSIMRSGDLAEGDSYTRTENVTIPQTAQGTYYVFVVADGSDAVEECDSETNNTGASTVTVNVTNNLPDLRVISVTAPGEAFAGQTVTVQWTAENVGTIPTQNPAWNDVVYFSTDATFDNSDSRIATALITGPVAVGDSYSAQAQATIPLISTAGSYYLIVRADADNFVFEGQREDNNTGFAAIQINIPAVDLQVTAVDAPSEAFSGQNIPVSWTVTNASTMQPFVSQWADIVILSRDQIVDPTDPVIGHLVHNGSLEGGASYTATLDVNVPAGLTGPYYIFVRTDRNNQVAETSESNNTGGPDGFTLQLPPPVDLTVTAINVPTTGSPGEQSTFQWTGQNIGPNTTTGSWRDAVYLSTDQSWDISDALVGRADQSGPLAPGQTYAGTLTAELPAINPGQYYVIVRTDVRNSIRENDETNNTTASVSTIVVDVVELQLDEPYSSTLGTGQERYHKVDVPGGETLLYTLDAEKNDSSTELFVRQGAMPSRSAFDFFFSRPNEADQKVLVPNTLAGFYYDLVRGMYVPDGVTPFTIKAEIVPFSIRSVSPNRVGDNGQVTITLNGAKFKEGATVKLVGNGTTLTATKVIVLDSATTKARFFFTNAPHGVYDVVLTNPDGPPTTVSSAITVEAATKLLAQLNLIGNLFPRAGGRMQLLGEFKNSSNVDIPYACVLGSFSGAARMGWMRPIDSAPLQARSPDVDWQYDSPTAFFDGSETVDTFCLRNNEPGQNTILALNISDVPAGRFRVRLFYHLETAAEFAEQQQSMYESLRQLYVSDPGLPLPSDLSSIVSDPVQWWQYFRQSLIVDGYLDDESPQSLRTTSANISLQANNNECDIVECFRRAEDKAKECALKAIRDSRTLATLSRRLDRCRLDKTKDFVDCNFKPCTPPDDPCSQAETGTCSSTNNSQCCNGDGRRATDPNDKQGPSGYGPQVFVPAQQVLPYTINFENVPTATAYAQRIRIVDQLGPNLDWRTFRLREIGFGKYRITVPENRAFFQSRIQLGEDLGNLLADISVGLNIATGQVTWTLTAIDPQTGEQPTGALLGLLPPNDDTNRGQGYVTFTVQPKTTTLTGTKISNKATIIFDTEEPIITNTVTNTLDADVPISEVASLPASMPPIFTISWSGDDPAGGSGIQSYDIWFSENDGPYQRFLTGTTETSTEFTGLPGTTYRFYSTARDNAGNVEAAPTSPDAITTVGDAPPNPVPTLISLSPSSKTAGGPQFTLTVNGTNFINDSAVNWNGSPHTTIYVSATQLTATIPASDIATEGTASVTVVNPPPGGGTSNALTFTIAPASPASADLAIIMTAAPDPVAAGSNIIYTMTVANNGPDAASSVTVSDNLPADTAFASCNATEGGVCGGSSNNRTVTFNSLAAGASAIITIVATVNASSVADGTVIRNTATVSAQTSDPNSTNDSATAATTVSQPSTCAADVSGQVQITRGGYRYVHSTQRFHQMLTLQNTGGSAITSPAALVLDGLSPQATLYRESGRTTCSTPLGSPFVNINVGSDKVFSSGESVQVMLEFVNPAKQAMTYNTRVLAGSNR